MTSPPPPPPPHRADELLYFVIWVRVASYCDELSLIRLSGSARILQEVCDADAVWLPRIASDVLQKHHQNQNHQRGAAASTSGASKPVDDGDDEELAASSAFVSTSVRHLLLDAQEHGRIPRFGLTHPAFSDVIAAEFFPQQKNSRSTNVTTSRIQRDAQVRFWKRFRGEMHFVNPITGSKWQQWVPVVGSSVNPSDLFTRSVLHPNLWATCSDSSSSSPWDKLPCWITPFFDDQEPDSNRILRRRIAREISADANKRLGLIATLREVRSHVSRVLKFMALCVGVSAAVYGAASWLSGGVASSVLPTELLNKAAASGTEVARAAPAVAFANSSMCGVSDNKGNNPLTMAMAGSIKMIAATELGGSGGGAAASTNLATSGGSGSDTRRWFSFLFSTHFWQKYFACIRDGFKMFPVPPAKNLDELISPLGAQITVGLIIGLTVVGEIYTTAKFGVGSLQELHRDMTPISSVFKKNWGVVSRMLVFQLPLYFVHTAVMFFCSHLSARASSAVAIPLLLCMRMLYRFFACCVGRLPFSELSWQAALDEGWWSETVEIPSFVTRSFAILWLQSRGFDIGALGDAFYARVVLVAASEAIWIPSVDKATLSGVRAGATALAGACLWNTGLYAARHAIRAVAKKYGF